MASSVIHLAVANEINKILKKDSSKLLIGSIAPDISKIVGETKEKSHFLDDVNDDLPNMERFLKKYKNDINDDFVLGYYIHLYTDYLWFKYFMTEITDKKFITRLDGTVVKIDEDTLCEYVYNDYTNLNIKLIDRYNLDLKIFYNEVPNIKVIINEIPMDKLNLIIDKAGIILANTKEQKEYVFDIQNVEKFINLSIELIRDDLNKILYS